MAAPFKVKATFDYASQEADDLSFPIGQIITVTEEIDADWYEGEYTDVTGIKKSGIFPNNFVEKYEPEVPSRPSRPARPTKEAQPAVASAPEPAPKEEHDDNEEEVSTPVPATSKPPSVSSAPLQQDAPGPPVKTEPDNTPAPESKKPPPVAPKSNAFKDRIAAFNAPAAAPILPFSQRSQPSTFIKKPFVAPPPSKDAFIPQPKQEPAHKPYVREEDPEIKQRQEEDLAAAQSAGLLTENHAAAEDEDAPKPQSLKERIAMLQQQQLEQAQKRADTSGVKKEKNLPTQTSEAPEEELDEAEEEAEAEAVPYQASADRRERPRVPTLPKPQDNLPIKSPALPQHEILSGGEEADQSAADEYTEDDANITGPGESDERPLPAAPARDAHPRGAIDDEEEHEANTEEAADEDEGDMDEETRRRLELRERMAKMSGGMGMAGMFGPPGGMPMPGMSAVKKPVKEKRSTDDSTVSSSPPQARVPMVPMPGIQRVMSPEADDDQGDGPPQRQASVASRRSLNETRGAPPTAPAERAVPAVPSSASRPVPKPPGRPAVPGTPTIAQHAVDDDDVPLASSLETPRVEAPSSSRELPSRPHDRTSYFAESGAPTSDKRGSRTPQASSGQPITSPRPPPPPPPALVSQDTNDGDDEGRGESEYEGDYDTDIASSAKHKDALGAHNRAPSYDDTTADEMSLASPKLPPPSSRAAPPPPPTTAPTSAKAPRQSSELTRAPPPPPVAQVTKSRQSTELPRAPPPMPPSRPLDDDEYDPYRYTQGRSVPSVVPQAAPPNIPPVPPRPVEDQDSEEDDDEVEEEPQVPTRQSIDRAPPPPPPTTQMAPQDRAVPPPPPVTAAPAPRAPPRQSLDLPSRRSLDQSRPSGEHGQIASDLELSQDTPWWTASEPLPPSLQGRNGVDLILESEESSTSKRGGRTTISKDVYVLFIDYSQTIITARYDSREPSDVSLEQRHEPPPARLRQDQLEELWNRFGKHVAETANNLGNSKKEAVVGDGSATSLVHELIKAQPQALPPVGVRAYGGLVYANLANASVMQFDEIRPGDIVTLRNARFEGKHSGGLHQKYKQELGASHVAIVNEWDGTKKKIRAWEQGREKKNALKSESYRLGDLKSGEVRVWRIEGRDWVGWDSNA